MNLKQLAKRLNALDREKTRLLRLYDETVHVKKGPNRPPTEGERDDR